MIFKNSFAKLNLKKQIAIKELGWIENLERYKIKFKESCSYGLPNIPCIFYSYIRYRIKHRVSHKIGLLLNSGLKDVITCMATLGIIFLNPCYYANLWKEWKHA